MKLLTCCVLGALLWDNMLMGALCSNHIATYILDLWTCNRIVIYVWLQNRHSCLRFSPFLFVSFSRMWSDWSFNLACCTTGVKSTHWVLTAIPLWIGVDNSHKNLNLCKHGKKLSSFRSCIVYKSYNSGYGQHALSVIATEQTMCA